MKLFVAVTTYENKIYSECSKSLLNNILKLKREGHEVIVHYESDLYIDLARNQCVHEFMKSNCSDILFIDADLSFEEDAMLKIIKHDKDLIAGAYRLKMMAESYPIVIDWSNNNNCKEEETGLVKVISAPTGFMRIRRKVFEEMIDYYKMQPCIRGIYHFFETGMKVFNDGKWWGEDTSFCHKWNNMGGKVFIEPTILFTHYGNQDFKGSLHNHLMGKSISREFNSDQDKIHGWMTEADIKIIKELSSKCEDVVEVGSWKGRSTKEFLETCKGKVYAVDHFKGNPKDMSGISARCFGDVFEEFKKNVGFYSNLVIKKGYSVDKAKEFEDKSVDMVFIDAGHEYEDVKADIEAWLPKTKKIIAGHDYIVNFPGVIQAVNEFAKDRDIKVKGTIWWCEL